MRIGVLGTGMVGKTIATKLVGLGNEVMMGSRTSDNEQAAGWVAAAGSGASQGTFADATGFGEMLFNCTSGAGSLDALRSAGAGSLAGKVLIDVANPLDFSQGHAAEPARMQYRLARRADPASLSRTRRGEGAEHDELPT